MRTSTKVIFGLSILAAIGVGLVLLRQQGRSPERGVDNTEAAALTTERPQLTATVPAAPQPIDEAAARSWRTADPIDMRLPASPLGPIDQSAAIPTTGQLQGSLAAAVGGDPLPDSARGAYDERTERIEINWVLLDALDPAGQHRVGIPLPEGGQLELVLVTSQWRSADQYTWFGQIAGVSNSDVILVRHGDALRVVARNLNADGRVFEIRPSPVGHVLAELGVLPGEGDDIAEPADPQAATDQAFEDETSGQSPGGIASLAAAILPDPSDPANVIDVMVVASDEARAAYGSPNAFVADAFAMIADANLRVSMSGGPWRFRLAAAPWSLIAGYREAGDISDDLFEMTYLQGEGPNSNQTPPVGPYAVDAITDAIQNNRDTYRPDLVVLIANSGGTGIGWVPGLASQLIVDGGYSVVSRDAAISNGTFAHEIGHNMGGCHNANSSAPLCNPNGGGLNGTARGIERYCDVPDVIFSDDTEYRTTMAYAVNMSDAIRRVRVQRYSVVGLTATLDNGLGTCTVNLWDTNARVMETFEFSRPTVSQYAVASGQIWVQPGGVGAQEGTWQEPEDSVRQGCLKVSGSGVVRAKAGNYNETAINGGPVLLTSPCTIDSDGGSITLF